MEENEAIQAVLSDFERARRNLPKVASSKATPAEREYSRLYDRLSLLGVGNRRRLRAKYRG